VPARFTRSPRSPALFPLGWLLRRVARMALFCGVSYQSVEALLKQSFLRSASEDFGSGSLPLTNSRISLLTGLHRNELRRLRAAREQEVPPPMSLPWRVVERWSDAPYVDARGVRAALPRLASVGGERSFEALVRSVSTDIRAPALLAEWLDQDVVGISVDDMVVFHESRFFALARKREEGANMLAFLCGDLMQGSLRKMMEGKVDSHEVRYFWLSHLTESSVAELRVAVQDVMDVRDRAYKLGLDLEERDKGRPDANRRFLMAAFRYDADMRSDPAYPAIGESDSSQRKPR